MSNGKCSECIYGRMNKNKDSFVCYLCINQDNIRESASKICSNCIVKSICTDTCKEYNEELKKSRKKYLDTWCK